MTTVIDPSPIYSIPIQDFSRHNDSNFCYVLRDTDQGGLAVETEQTQSQKHAEKRGAYPPSAARCVRRSHVSLQAHVFCLHSDPALR